MITRRAAAAGLAASLTGLSFTLRGAAAPQGAAENAGRIWRAAPARAPLLAGKEATEVWAFEGMSNPVLAVDRGADLALRLENGTPLPLSLHVHGARGPNERDGAGGLTEEPLAPGASRLVPVTTSTPGTFLIRPCMIGGTAEPAERGLSAMLVVREASPPEVEKDVALLVDDWLLSEDGALAPFAPSAGTPLGRLGNLVTVNGKAAPERHEIAPGGRVRLRLANACNARAMRLRFDGLKVSVIAVDSNPTDGFEPLNGTLPFAPGSRYDLLAQAPDRAGLEGRVIAALGEGIALATFVVAGDALPPRKPASPPRPDHALPASIRLESAVRRDVVLQGDERTPWSVNGSAGTVATPMMKVKRGSPVVLALANRTPFPQPLHLHGHAFRRLHALDDGWEPYFMDTVVVPEQRTVRIAFVADNPGRWLLASTVLERFDAGLWTWFEVT